MHTNLKILKKGLIKVSSVKQVFIISYTHNLQYVRVPPRVLRNDKPSGDQRRCRVGEPLDRQTDT